MVGCAPAPKNLNRVKSFYVSVSRSFSGIIAFIVFCLLYSIPVGLSFGQHNPRRRADVVMGNAAAPYPSSGYKLWITAPTSSAAA